MLGSADVPRYYARITLSNVRCLLIHLCMVLRQNITSRRQYDLYWSWRRKQRDLKRVGWIGVVVRCLNSDWYRATHFAAVQVTGQTKCRKLWGFTKSDRQPAHPHFSPLKHANHATTRRRSISYRQRIAIQTDHKRIRPPCMAWNGGADIERASGQARRPLPDLQHARIETTWLRSDGNNYFALPYLWANVLTLSIPDLSTSM